MDYKSFKKYVEENIRYFLPKEYEGAGLLIQSVQKTNRELDALVITPAGNKLTRIMPTLYINDMYKRYMLGDSVDEILKNVGEVFMQSMDFVPKEIINIFDDKEKLKKDIVVALINTESNKEFLKDVVHREFQDLSIIYKWIIRADEEGVLSTTLRNEHLEKLGMTEEELYKVAMENTNRKYPVTTHSMVSLFEDLFTDEELNFEEIAAFEREAIHDGINTSDMFVITNSTRTNGATAMLFEDKMYEFSQSYGGSFYIIPSSLHELIVVSPKFFEPYELAKMVYEVNRDEVEVGERLSNEVYFYDQDKREVVRVTDVPNKSLRDMGEGDISYLRDEPEVSR